MLMAAYMSQNEVVGIHFAWALFRLADEPWQSKLWGILMWGYVPNMWHDLSWRKLVEFHHITVLSKEIDGLHEDGVRDLSPWRTDVWRYCQESKALTRQQRRASNDQKFRDFHTMSRFVKDSIANKTLLNIHLCHYVTWAFHRTTFLRCCVVCGWAPDGRHFLGATTAPRRLGDVFEKPRIPSRACKAMRLTLPYHTIPLIVFE